MIKNTSNRYNNNKCILKIKILKFYINNNNKWLINNNKYNNNKCFNNSNNNSKIKIQKMAVSNK